MGVNGREFIRRVRRLGRKEGLPVAWVPAHGKGSHGRPYLGDRFTAVKDRKQDLDPRLFTAMCIQIGIDPREL